MQNGNHLGTGGQLIYGPYQGQQPLESQEVNPYYRGKDNKGHTANLSSSMPRYSATHLLGGGSKLPSVLLKNDLLNACWKQAFVRYPVEDTQI